MPKTVAKAKNDAKAKLQNLVRLLAYDRQHRFVGRSTKPQCILVGTDEVGRGCFAGPVVAAAVMLPEIEEKSSLAKSLAELNDSKKLNSVQRERLAAIIHEIGICAIAQSSVEEINEINILQASLMAMRRALDQLSERLPDTMPILVLVDGNKAVTNIGPSYVQSTVIQGDSTSASIAAASIIAKVYRDQMMLQLAQEFPHYGWESNKGYGSKTHREALRQHGMTVWHRKLFCENALYSENVDEIARLEHLYEDETALELISN